MRIDNRIFIPFVLPFVLLGLFRALWFAAGAGWSDPTFAAIISLMSGLALGLLWCKSLFEKGIHLGHTTIGRKPKDPEGEG